MGCWLKQPSHSLMVIDLQLASAYTPEILPFTNYTYDFRGMIDYVFYDTKSLQPLGVLGPFSDEWMAENKVVGCPHPHIHSGKEFLISSSSSFHPKWLLHGAVTEPQPCNNVVMGSNPLGSRFFLFYLFSGVSLDRVLPWQMHQK